MGREVHFLMAPHPHSCSSDGSKPSAPPPLSVKGAVNRAETQPLSLYVPLPGWGHVAVSEEASFPHDRLTFHSCSQDQVRTARRPPFWVSTFDGYTSGGPQGRNPSLAQGGAEVHMP